MNSRVIVVGIFALALTALSGVEKLEAQQKTTCEASADFDFSPGFWREGNSGTFTTNGETWPVICNGPVNGKNPTGQGTYGASGRYGTKDPDNCSNAEGVYDAAITIPTADGPQKVKNKGDWVAGAFKGGGAFGGEFTGEAGDGTFETTPKKGDCVSSPMTQIHGVIRWMLKG
jgi:hypothetical protein